MTHPPQSIQPTQAVWDEVPMVVYQLTSPQGENRAHRVILLHGLNSSSAQWFDTLSILSAAGHNSMAFDLPGHGKSDRYFTKSLNPRWMGEAMATWLQAQPPLPTILVGHSLGGWVVLRACLSHPEAIAGLVLVASAGLQEKFLKQPKLNYSQGLANVTRQILDNLFYQPQRVEPRLLQAVLGEAISSYSLLSFGSKELLQPQELQQIHCPVQLIWGEQDRILPVEWAQVFARHLPNSTLTVLPECGHLPHLELPKLFHHHLLQFLTSLILV